MPSLDSNGTAILTKKLRTAAASWKHPEKSVIKG
jgi:hypothetical protein